jgi:hypothetical protein
MLCVKGVPGGGITWYQGSYNPWDTEFIPKPFLEDMYLVPFIASVSSMTLIFIIDLVGPAFAKQKLIKGWLRARDWVTQIRESNYRKGSVPKKQVYALTAIVGVVMSILLFTSLPIIRDGFDLKLISSQPGVDVFAASGDIRIGTQQFITPSNGEQSPFYNISLAQNEYESMQLIVRPRARTINGLSYKITNFTRNDMVFGVPASEVGVRYVENVYDNTMPDKLVPFSMIHLIEQRNHILWITVHVPYMTAAGTYFGNITFTYGNQESFMLRLSLDVWNFTITNNRHIRSNFGDQFDDDQRMMTFATHKINSYGVPIRMASTELEFEEDETYTCWYNESKEDWEFQWDYWDAKTEEELMNGANGFAFFGPLGMPREPVWFESDMVLNTNGMFNLKIGSNMHISTSLTSLQCSFPKA